MSQSVLKLNSSLTRCQRMSQSFVPFFFILDTWSKKKNLVISSLSWSSLLSFNPWPLYNNELSQNPVVFNGYSSVICYSSEENDDKPLQTLVSLREFFDTPIDASKEF